MLRMLAAQLPKESAMFDEVNSSWIESMARLQQAGTAYKGGLLHVSNPLNVASRPAMRALRPCKYSIVNGECCRRKIR